MKSHKSNKPSDKPTSSAKRAAKPAAADAKPVKPRAPRRTAVSASDTSKAKAAKAKAMTIEALIATPSELTDTATSKCAIVMMTRIRLARNLSNHRFPGWADEARRAEILETCRTTLNGTDELESGFNLEIAKLSDLQKQILVERHLISRELSTAKPGAGVVISNDQTCSVMINEEDHLRIQFLRAGFQLKKTWAAINALDSALEDRLEYAFSPSLGYLTACPTNVGTGMRASAMMHLPALVISSQMEKVVRAVNQLGMVVRGLFGEGSDASGSIFQISNQTTLGESEEQIIKRLTSVLNSIVEHELNARARLIEKDPAKLFDKIGRAYGILQNSHLLTSGEAMNLLSLVRLGIDLGTYPDATRAIIDRLIIETQPGHIQHAAKKPVPNASDSSTLEPAQRDQLRADRIRAEFKTFPAPNYDTPMTTPEKTDDQN